jgi:hypothetical protein
VHVVARLYWCTLSKAGAEGGREGVAELWGINIESLTCKEVESVKKIG